MEKNKKAYTVFAWAALCLLAFTFILPAVLDRDRFV